MSAAQPIVAVVGLGAMGSRLAANLLTDGYRVIVTNRTPAAAAGLAAAGAVVAASPREAAAGADVVLAVVSDDPASRAIWTDPEHGLLGGLRSGRVAVECSTVSPAWVRELAGVAVASGARFLEAPMIGSRPQVDARALVHLVGGAEETLDEVRGVLEVSATRTHHCGEVGVAERSGLAVGATMDLLASLPVTSPAVARAGGAMINRAFNPNFPVDLVAKDLRYLSELATRVPWQGADEQERTRRLPAALGRRARARGSDRDRSVLLTG